MLPKMELTDPVLLGIWDGRSDFVDRLCVKLSQCPKQKTKKKEREKEQEEVEGEVIINRHAGNYLGNIFCGFM